MRRISLALALAGAVAAGCGQSSAPSVSGGSKGIESQRFKLTVRGEKAVRYAGALTRADGTVDPSFDGTLMLPEGGVVTVAGTSLDCGIDATGTAHPTCQTLIPYQDPATSPGSALTVSALNAGFTVYAWAGACGGQGACAVVMNADRFVAVRFARDTAGLGSHPDLHDPAVHSPAYFAGVTGAAGSYRCTDCHGASLQGAGLAPACGSCHTAAAVTFFRTNTAAVAHDAANVAFTAMFAGVAGGTAGDGPAVTAVCNACHHTRAAEFMQTQHWTWKGPTPQLRALDSTFQATAGVENPGTIGKANLINNFCVSVASSERRCDQCHAGYGNPGTNTSARSATYLADPTRVDCLICHARSVTGNMAAGGYNKIAGAFGAAGAAVGPGTPYATAAQLKDWAANVQLPTRENCGWCHFNGGGADSVKIMGTQLRTPLVTTDVHMSADTANGGLDMGCAACHSAGAHRIRGAGVHTPTSSARVSCSDCHTDAPHASATLDAHTATIACQTCHIPALSRQMPQKTDWDWSTAGAKQLGTGGTIYACVSGSTEVPYDGNNCLTAGGAKVKKYDYMKGTFAWGQNVAPTYRWYNGTMTHVVTGDKGAFTVETGLTPASRITLSAPLGSRGDGKIAPFKVMTGRQAVYVDDASGGSFIITPNLFHDGADGADGGFWGVLSAQPPGTTHAYTYLGTITPDAFGAPDAPLAGSFVLNQTATFTGTSYGGYTVNAAGDQTVTYSIETLLAKVFTRGATLAGQVPAGTAQFARFDGTNPGWDWRYTRMFLDLEHEVAPKAQAIGAGGNCAACHGPSPVIPICELYAGVPASELPWGVTCP